MESGLLVFTGIGFAIIVFALIVSRLMRKTLHREMPGEDIRQTEFLAAHEAKERDLSGDL
ncbi:MAG: hypothetical protein AAGI92_01330 [Pseudomonadota bacterium]